MRNTSLTGEPRALSHEVPGSMRDVYRGRWVLLQSGYLAVRSWETCPANMEHASSNCGGSGMCLCWEQTDKGHTWAWSCGRARYFTSHVTHQKRNESLHCEVWIGNGTIQSQASHHTKLFGENYGQEPVAIHLICTGLFQSPCCAAVEASVASRSTAEDAEKALCRQVLQILGFASGTSATAREVERDTSESTTTQDHENSE